MKTNSINAEYTVVTNNTDDRDVKASSGGRLKIKSGLKAGFNPQPDPPLER